MRAKRAHALTLAETPPHPAAFCNVPPMFPVVVCVRACTRMFALSVSFHRAGSCFMVFPATSRAYSNSICFGGECDSGGRKNITTKHNTNTVHKTASFHERVAPPNECEMRRDFTFASERFAVCFARFCTGSVHPSCQNPVKSSLVGPPLHNIAFVEREAKGIETRSKLWKQAAAANCRQWLRPTRLARTIK